eukprot:c21866_g1_i1 orf=963-2363(+)
MAGRLAPAAHYNLNGRNVLIASALHDLNTVDTKNGMEGIPDGDGDDPTGDSLDQEQDSSNSADCVPQSYGHSLQLQGVGVVGDHSLPLEGDEPPRSPYGVLNMNDVLPIEAARSRFLQILLDYFITAHVIPVPDSPESNYGSANSKDKQKKRKSREVQYEGDPKYVLPLAYVANLYETLINEVNSRLASVEGFHEKTIGVALEAAGGLYRRLVKKYPKTGQPYTFKRREMASAMEARNKFPHLVTREEKRVRFVVVHGLELVERPSLPYDDAEWFKRLTGRHEAEITERDYRFFSPRHKYRRAPQNTLANVATLPAFAGMDAGTLSSSSALRASVVQQYNNEAVNITTRSPPPFQLQHQSHQFQCHTHVPQHAPTHQQHQTHLPSHVQHTAHSGHLTDPSHIQHSSPVQHIPRGLHSPSAVHVGGRLVVMPPQLAKYCDECGTPYPRETSKYCSECGTKRVFIGAP